MGALSYLKDRDFLKALDNDNNKFYWVKIDVLNMEELTIASIEGRVQPGSSISINGSSSVRRTCTVTFIAEEEENDLTDVDNLLSINRKIKIQVGLKNNIDERYDPIIWFPQGIFVINQPSITHGTNGCLIQLSCKDKMCLLNGENAGGFPTSVTFDVYYQKISMLDVDFDPTLIVNRSKYTPNNYTVYHYGDKYYTWSKYEGFKSITSKEAANKVANDVVSVKQRLYDIILTVVANFGGEDISRIIINDLPLEIKQLMRYTGTAPLYYNFNTGEYTLDSKSISGDNWKEFHYNDDIGYDYVDFCYPGKDESLVGGIGDNVCTILDKIKDVLGNYEYFYDINGNFVFQEIKNYLNNTYTTVLTDSYDAITNGEQGYNDTALLKPSNFQIDIRSNTSSIYTFNEGTGLVSSYSNSPNYMNIKNDFHIWGETESEKAIHYHLAIKELPIKDDIENNEKVFRKRRVIYLKGNDGLYNGKIRLAKNGEAADNENYRPQDWRAELYCQGLEKIALGQRPDIYEQELLDLFDDIYNMKDKKFKEDLDKNPNGLYYFFDYLPPVKKLYDCSVDLIKTKIYTYKNDKIKRLFNTEVPNCILIPISMDLYEREKLTKFCQDQGQICTSISTKIFNMLVDNTAGYTAQESMRELLYQYTNYNETISIQCIPIYYLEPNTRITVQDIKSGIYGDFIIKTITLPISPTGLMTINATRALERI